MRITHSYSRTLIAIGGLLFIGLLLLTQSSAVPANSYPGSANSYPDNLDFELTTWKETLWWDPSGVHTTQFNEVNPPIAWTAFWYEGFPCSANPSFMQGRPEFRLIDTTIDLNRIFLGRQAAQIFTFWRCGEHGLLQQLPTTSGLPVTLTAWGHAWFTRCSSKPYSSLPLDFDCTTPITWAHATMRVGIDPTGGTDPHSPSVVWSSPYEYYGKYTYPLSVSTTALSSTATAFLWANADNPLKHNDFYWDYVTWTVTRRFYLPLIARSSNTLRIERDLRVRVRQYRTRKIARSSNTLRMERN